jgi:hypothetical protein
MESVMKDAEDEAFDELAKRQGHWGGGYQAKKAMAADKLQETVSFPCCGYTDAIKWNQFNGVVQCHMCGQVYTVARPAQEPVAIRLSNGMIDVLGGALVPIGTLLYLTPAQEPVAYVTGVYAGRFVVAPLNPAMVLPTGMALYAGPA